MNKSDTATTMDKTNEHRPGYQWTKLGWVPEEWEVIYFGDTADLKNGLNYSADEVGTGLKIIGVGDFQDNQTIEYDDLQKINVEGRISAEYLLNNDDLVFVRSNGNKALIGRALLIENLNEKISHSGFTIRARVQTENLLPRYLIYFFNSELTNRQYHKYGSGTNISNLSQEILNRIQLPFPPLPEQKKIAAILSTWDAAIQALQELIAAKEQQQKGLMQRLLTGAVRFGEFVAPWETYRFSNLFQRVTRKNTEDNKNVLTISAQYGLINQRDFFNKDVSGKDLTNYYLLKRGEFAYNKSYSSGYPLGAIKRLDKYEKGVVSTLYICFRLKSKNHDSDFLLHFFEGGRVNHEIFKIAQEGARNHGLLNISVHDFFEMYIQLPGLEEQKKIAEALNKFSEELNAFHEKLDTLKAQKKGLMQRLLTGEVRTI